MKKFMLSMMIMAMTVIGTISASGATKVNKDIHRGKAACTAVHCKHRHNVKHNVHRNAWKPGHKHAFNRHNVCVKCKLSKKQINRMMRKHARHNHRTHSVCAPRPVMYRR